MARCAVHAGLSPAVFGIVVNFSMFSRCPLRIERIVSSPFQLHPCDIINQVSIKSDKFHRFYLKGCAALAVLNVDKICKSRNDNDFYICNNV